MRYISLLVDSDSKSRHRLKDAAGAVYALERIEFQTALPSALAHLEVSAKYDIIFVAQKFPEPEIKDFIEKAKAMKGGEDAAYVLLMEGTNQNRTVIAAGVMIGADGFLFEPFSVDQLVEIAELAAKVRRERCDLRERTAVSIMMGDVISQIDTMATMKKAGFETNSRKLQDLTQNLQSFGQKSLETYVSIAAQAFEKAPVPPPVPSRMAYKGVSERIKKRMEEKVRARVAASARIP